MRLEILHMWAVVVASVSGVGVGQRYKHRQEVTEQEQAIYDRPDICCGSVMPNAQKTSAPAVRSPVFGVLPEAETFEVRQVSDFGKKRNRDHPHWIVTDGWSGSSQGEMKRFTPKMNHDSHSPNDVTRVKETTSIPASHQRPSGMAGDRAGTRHRFRGSTPVPRYTSTDSHTPRSVVNSERGAGTRTYRGGSQLRSGGARPFPQDSQTTGNYDRARSESTSTGKRHRHSSPEVSRRASPGTDRDSVRSARRNHPTRKLYRVDFEDSPEISTLFPAVHHGKVSYPKQGGSTRSRSYLADSPASLPTSEHHRRLEIGDESSFRDALPLDNSLKVPEYTSNDEERNQEHASLEKEESGQPASSTYTSQGKRTSRIDTPEDDRETRMDIPELCCGSKVPLDLDNALSTGGLSRVASAGSIKVIEVPAVDTDNYPPVDVRDLKVVPLDTHSVTLTWTTPGDDLDYGTASSYVIRLTDRINDLQESQFDRAPERTLLRASEILVAAGAYQVAGTAVRVTIPLQEPLQEGNVYYVALKAYDNHGNASPVSNLARFSIPLPALGETTIGRSETTVEDDFAGPEAASGHRILAGVALESLTPTSSALDVNGGMVLPDRDSWSGLAERKLNVLEPVEPGLSVTEPGLSLTEPGLRVSEPTEPGLRVSEPTESGLRVSEPTEPGLRVSEPTEPGLRVSEPAEPGLRVSEPTEPGLRVSEPTEPGLRVSEPTEPGLRVSEPTEPGLRVSEPTEPGLRVSEPTEPGLRVSEPTEPGLTYTNPQISSHLTTDFKSARTLGGGSPEVHQTQERGRGKKNRKNKKNKKKNVKKDGRQKQKKQRRNQNEEETAAGPVASNTNPYEDSKCFLEDIDDPGLVSLCDARYSLSIVIAYFQQNHEYKHLDYLSDAMHSLEQKTLPFWQRERRARRRRRRRGWRSGPRVPAITSQPLN
nr:uncharacterized protein LOC123759653 isoform X1 [Procambarus clarkii]